MKEMIPLEECIDRHIYLIHARNFGVGIYNKLNNGFIGIREKWGDEYLATEYHYDMGRGNWGTARPYKDLGSMEEFASDFDEGNVEYIRLYECHPRVICEYCGDVMQDGDDPTKPGIRKHTTIMDCKNVYGGHKNNYPLKRLIEWIENHLREGKNESSTN